MLRASGCRWANKHRRAPQISKESAHRLAIPRAALAYELSVPLVLGMPVMRGSGSTAMRRRGPCLEDRFGDVMVVTAVVQHDVQIHQGIGRHGLPEILDQLAVEIADLGAGELGLKHQEISAAQDRWPR